MQNLVICFGSTYHPAPITETMPTYCVTQWDFCVRLDWRWFVCRLHCASDSAHVADENICRGICSGYVGPGRVPSTVYRALDVLIMDPPLIVMSALAVTHGV